MSRTTRVPLYLISPLLAALFAVMLAAGEPRAAAQADQRCFAETGFCISGRIRAFYEQNGDLPVFGLPIGPLGPYTAADGQVVQAQWFERQRLELHPENAPPYDVLLGRLGADRLAQLGVDWRAFPQFDPGRGAQADCQYFAQTGHAACGLFLDYWNANGLSLPGASGVTPAESLALFGYPISEAVQATLEDGQLYTVQWFERARMELHPAGGPPYTVLLGLLGDEVLDDQSVAPPAPAPTAQPVSSPALVQEVAVELSGPAPATVTVHAQGILPDSCTTLGDITQQREGAQLFATIMAVRNAPPDAACAQVAQPFDRRFTLDWPLDAGSYTITVNGVQRQFSVAAPGWGGDWNCLIIDGPDCGRLSIVLDGGHAAGSFGQGGTISGSINAGTLVGTWSQGGQSGSFSLGLAGDGRTFAGTWQPGNQIWCGWRDGAAAPVVCSP